MLHHIGKPVPGWQTFSIDSHTLDQLASRFPWLNASGLESLIRAGRYIKRAEIRSYFDNRINDGGGTRQFIYSHENAAIFYVYENCVGQFIVATVVEAKVKIQYLR